MLDNIITLPVDIQNTGTTTNLDYQRFDSFQNRSVYISENHLPGNRDTLSFYRTFPKVAGNFKGVRKSTFKFSRDVTVDTVDGGTTDSQLIIEVSCSFPVGVTTAQILEARQRAVALLDKDAVMDQLHDLQVI